MALDTNWVSAWLAAAATAVAEHKQELNTLDREIGDGDHGENMDRGMRAAVDALGKLPDGTTPNAALRSVAMTLISTVGGASGPLYGTAFLKAAEPVGDSTELDGADLVALLAAAEEGARATEPLVARKGRASYLGERSAGHRDPGAQSTALILRAAAEVAE